MKNLPMPINEIDRLISLSDLDLDYSDCQETFKDLSKLAASIAGTEISLVNLIDSYTQWSISAHGLMIEQLPREESICQYTIASQHQFEVNDLSADELFRDRFFVNGELGLRYYFGVPLKTSKGHNIGSLCVIDKEPKILSAEKIESLKIIADEIVKRLNAFKLIADLKRKLFDASQSQKKVAHDIRGPIGGIIGLAELIIDQGTSNKIDEVLEFTSLIQKSGQSVLELADEIMSAGKPQTIKDEEFNLLSLKGKLESLYQPQAQNKNIQFAINTTNGTLPIPFFKNKLLQITGNLVSNAMKFTPRDGKVTVELNLEAGVSPNLLSIKVKDTGVGMDEETINAILDGNVSSTEGTRGEQG